MSQPRRLILHVGFPKTGSSAIQAWLAKNAHELARKGIAYRGFVPAAAQDAITSGNAKLLLDLVRAAPEAFAQACARFERAFVPHYFADLDTAIVSGESLARTPEPRLKWFARYCAAQELSVSILAYCRTLYEHCYSEYQQQVKRGGETRTFRDYAAAYDNPQCKWIRCWHEVFGDAFKLRLYDAVKEDLIADFSRQADIDRLGLDPRQGNVNRGLTSTELELLRLLNGYHGGVLGRELSDALIYADPSPKAQNRFDAQIAQDFEKRFASQVAAVNEAFFREGGERLEVVKYPDPGGNGPLADPRTAALADPVVMTALRVLCELAKDARQREARLRCEFAVARARAAMAEADWDSARTQLERALQIDPESARARRLMERLERRGRRPADLP